MYCMDCGADLDFQRCRCDDKYVHERDFWLGRTPSMKIVMALDIVDVKLIVMKAACGITALSELDLLHRLERLYLEGYKRGMDDLFETTNGKVAAHTSTAGQK